VTSQAADPATLKQQQRRSFDDTAHGRRKWHAVVAPPTVPVTEMLLTMARVTEGSWVLDVGCGIGDVALAAARRVGPTGRVVGIDLSPRSLAIAEERAREEELTVVGFHQEDAETLIAAAEGSYEAVVSRFGLSFLPQLDLALAGIHRVLLRGGRVAFANWGPIERVPFIAVGRNAVADYVGRALAPPSQPGPFALSRPGLLEQALSSAGFGEIRAERLTVLMVVPSAEAYVDLLRESTALGQLVAEGATVGTGAVWGAVKAAAAPYADPAGRLSFPCEVLCVAARRASR
jgi:SAM-dependent methyltransferase